MATQSPFSIPEPLLQGFASLADTVVGWVQTPAWLTHEIQQRLVLLLNHVVQQEPEAMNRLARQAGRTLEGRWRQFELQLALTKAGLFEVQPKTSSAEGTTVLTRPADLLITLQDASVAPILGALARGDKPALKIEGDVQLAADINWVVDHVRWDVEEDLSRILGDAPASLLVSALKSAWSRRPQ
jgi:ubiquinone biosynthesis protein UbiJ